MDVEVHKKRKKQKILIGITKNSLVHLLSISTPGLDNM